MRTLKTVIPACTLGLFFGLLANGDQTNTIPVIRVTAQRFENSEMSVPTDVSIISSDAIEQSQARSVPEFLQQKANLHIRSSNGKGNTGEISMRGFGENSGLRVLVIVDGQKMNRADMGPIDWQQLPLENIQSIEVIRGGQNVLYGNHALSGVIKITTKKGGAQQVKLKASTGSYGFQEYNAFYSGASDPLFYTAGVNYQRDEGFRDHALSWSKNINLSLGSLLGDSDTLIVKAAAGENYLQFPGPLSYSDFLDDPTQSISSNDFARTKNLLITALWEGERSWGSFKINSGFNLRNIASEFGGNTGANNQQGYSFSPQIRVGDEKNFCSGGVDLFYDTIDFSGNQGATFNRAQLSRIIAGAFLFAQKQLTQTLSISGGARIESANTKGKNTQYTQGYYDRFGNYYPPVPNPTESFDGTVKKQGWSDSLALNWQPTGSFSAWIGYSRIYRYPSLDEAASYQGFAMSDPLNENLDPETGSDMETGIKYRTEHWRASATLFYLMLDNEIAYDVTQNLNVNLGATRHLGSDLELSYETKNWGASTLLSFVKATFDGGTNDGNAVPLVPEFQNTSELWLRPVKPLRISGRVTWLSDQFEGGDFSNSQSHQIKSYSLVGLRADWTLNQHIKLFGKIDNLTDKRYASSAYNGGYYPGQGRSFYAGASLEF